MSVATVRIPGSLRAQVGGAATVEMAVVAPVLFMLILGSIEFGRSMQVTNVLTSAAREGARLSLVATRR